MYFKNVFIHPVICSFILCLLLGSCVRMFASYCESIVTYNVVTVIIIANVY